MCAAMATEEGEGEGAPAAAANGMGDRWTRVVASGWKWKAMAMGGELGTSAGDGVVGDWGWPREVAISLS